MYQRTGARLLNLKLVVSTTEIQRAVNRDLRYTKDGTLRVSEGDHRGALFGVGGRRGGPSPYPTEPFVTSVGDIERVVTRDAMSEFCTQRVWISCPARASDGVVSSRICFCPFEPWRKSWLREGLGVCHGTCDSGGELVV
jgi:hypothetical protein